MELAKLLPFLAVLACPIGMGLMMWLMMRNPGDQSLAGHPVGVERLMALRQQRHQLEQEIVETEKIVALEAEKATLVSSAAPVDQMQPVGGANQ